MRSMSECLMAALPTALAASLAIGVSLCVAGWAAAEDSTPSQVPEPEGTPVRIVAFDDHRQCGVTARGSLHCWEEDGEPTLIRGVSRPKSVLVRGKGVCFLSRSGALGCSGPVPSLRGLAASEQDVPDEDGTTWLDEGVRDFDFAVGYASAHLCAIQDDYTVACVGSNTDGQVGDGSTVDRATPVPVLVAVDTPLRDVQSLHLTASRSCAVTTQGALYCWGANHPLDQARAYHGPKRYTFATEVPLSVPVARMGDRCLISKDRQQYCWGIVDRETEKMATTPIARDRCGLSTEGVGTYCSLTRARELVCGEGNNRLVRKLRPGEHFADFSSRTCIGSTAQVTCFNERDLLDEPQTFGFAKPDRTPFIACQGEPPRDEPPEFPPHDYDHVEVSGAGFSGGPLRLNKAQERELIDIASSPDTFTDMTTCYFAEVFFHFIDEAGDTVGQVAGEGCTLAIWPGSAADLFGDGNVVTPETRTRMEALVHALRVSARR